MSNSTTSPTSASTNGTSNEPPPSPPSPTVQAPPPMASNSPPPLVSPPSPPTSSSNSTSEPPSDSDKPDSPPPSSSPPAPPPDNSSPPPPPPSSSVSPLPSPPPSDNPPSSSAPPPSSNSGSPSPPEAHGQSSPPPPHAPPTSEHSPPSPPFSPPVTSSPPPKTSPSTPSPPDAEIPAMSPPVPPVNPLVPENPAGSPPSPTLHGTPPSTSSPTPITDTPVNPSRSTTPDTKSPGQVPLLTPPSIHRGSSPTHSSKIPADGFGHGAIVGVTLAGVVVVLVAIFIFTLRKRKRKMGGLVNHYKPPNSFSVKSDGYYYRQAKPVGNSIRSDAYYTSKPPPSPSSAGNTVGSYGGYASHAGPTESAGIGNSKSWFTYEEITEMTKGFSRENLLGEGGFGCVYKGWLPDGRVVAVKQLKSGSGQGEREFRAEVEIISRVHHRHLVSLVGYCIADHQRSLVYEFVPNNTLEHHLHDQVLPVMDWPKRVKIAIGSARGLAYLHEDCHPRIIHRDIKSANILLDNSFEAQVADFGLAKLSNDTHTHVSTRVMGTFGYMAPEYASSGKLTDRSDVYSFGVVLLELITGRKPVDPSQPLGDESLVELARPLLVRALETGNFEELADPRLENNYVKSEMFRMMEAAAACVRHSAPKRPRMVQVLRALDNEGELSDLTNGVKFGQSTVFDSSQYSADIQMFRRMAFGSNDYSSDHGHSGEYDHRSSVYSGEYNTREAPHMPLNPLGPGELVSGEHQSSSQYSEPRGTNRRGNDDQSFDGSHRFNGRGFV